MGYIQGEGRNQARLFPVVSGDFVPTDHICRRAIKERVGAGQDTGPAAPGAAGAVNYPPKPGWEKGTEKAGIVPAPRASLLARRKPLGRYGRRSLSC
jgi:hypothetical protein